MFVRVQTPFLCASLADLRGFYVAAGLFIGAVDLMGGCRRTPNWIGLHSSHQSSVDILMGLEPKSVPSGPYSRIERDAQYIRTEPVVDRWPQVMAVNDCIAGALATSLDLSVLG